MFCFVFKGGGGVTAVMTAKAIARQSCQGFFSEWPWPEKDIDFSIEFKLI